MWECLPPDSPGKLCGDLPNYGYTAAEGCDTTHVTGQVSGKGFGNDPCPAPFQAGTEATRHTWL